MAGRERHYLYGASYRGKQPFLRGIKGVARKERLLASNGMLIKRPLVMDGETVLVGFKEAQWAEKLK